ncbi:MAG TPA: PQQ-binding-like beta-propeller repeat protein, partial [Anaeromyxobacteraceae bacterium]|nr:PQQ-binding-like beta-propeller repeat protein [Anaeromyxobacteraceae bacterium]
MRRIAAGLLLALFAALPAGAQVIEKRGTVVPSLVPAPLQLYRIAWQRSLVAPAALEWRPVEAGTPAVDPATGLVVVGTRDGWVQAFRDDGTRVWERQVEGSAGGAVVDGDTVYVGSTGGVLHAFAVGDGRERWKYDTREELGTRPVVVNGRVYVASLQDTVFAIDAQSGAFAWHHRRDTPSGFTVRGAASVAVADGLVFAAYSDGFAAGLDAATGVSRWERQIAPAGEYLDIDSIRLDGSRLYAAAYSGAVIALDARTGRQAWLAATPEVHRIAVAPGLVVAVTARAIVGLSPSDGSTVWTAPLDGAPAGEPVMVGRWLAVP